MVTLAIITLSCHMHILCENWIGTSISSELLRYLF